MLQSFSCFILTHPMGLVFTVICHYCHQRAEGKEKVQQFFSECVVFCNRDIVE